MVDICEQAKQGFDFAARYAELLITLAVGLVGLSITFTKEILRVMPRRASPILFLSWVVLGGSVFFGFFHHGGLIGDLLQFPSTVDTATDSPSNPTPSDSVAATSEKDDQSPECLMLRPSTSTMKEGRRQWWTFFIGTALFVVYGVVGHFFHDPPARAKPVAAASSKGNRKR